MRGTLYHRVWPPDEVLPEIKSTDGIEGGLPPPSPELPLLACGMELEEEEEEEGQEENTLIAVTTAASSSTAITTTTASSSTITTTIAGSSTSAIANGAARPVV